jgi:hypothetical protein
LLKPSPSVSQAIPWIGTNSLGFTAAAKAFKSATEAWPDVWRWMALAPPGSIDRLSARWAFG